MIAIYTRLSKRDDESMSINNQIREGIEYAKLNNFKETEIKIYNEGEGVKGGSSISDRPELNRLLKDIEDDLITIVWTRKQSRLARKLKLLEQIFEAMMLKNVKLYMGDRGLMDLGQPATKMMLQVFAAVDEFAPSSQAAETKKALRDNAREGKVSGILPYGYYSVKQYPKINKEEKRVVNKVFDLYLEGFGYQRISKYLNDNKVPTKYNLLSQVEKTKNVASHERHREGIVWGPSTIQGMIECTWYNGIRVYGNEEYEVPRMVSEEKWLLVQKKKQSQRYKRFDNTPKWNYLLKDVLKCGTCDRNYLGRIVMAKDEKYYLCSSKRTKRTNCGNLNLKLLKIDTFIVKHLLESKDLLRHLENIYSNNTVVNDLNTQLSNLESLLVSTKRKVDKYATILGEDDELTDDEIIIRKYKGAKIKVKELTTKIVDIKHEIGIVSSNRGLEKYRDTFDTFNLSDDFTALYGVVNNLIDEVIVIGQKDKNNKPFIVLQIKYNELNFGEESMIWRSSKPYNKWSPVIHKRPASKSEVIQGLEDYNDDRIHGDFTFNVEDESITTTFGFKDIVINNDDLIDFNKNPPV